MIFTAFAELFSLASIVPFLAILSDPSSLSNISYFSQILFFVNLTGFSFSEAVTFLFISAVIFVGFLRLFNLWSNGKISGYIGTDLSYKAYKSTLYQPYDYHLQNNSSIIISTIANNVSVLVEAVNAFLLSLTSSLIAISLFLGLLLINWQIALLISLTFIFSYILLLNFTKNTILFLGSSIVQRNQNLIKLTQESIGSIRDIIVSNSYAFFLSNFRNNDYPLRQDIAYSRFLSSFPRYGFESLGIVLLSLIGYYSVSTNGFNQSIISVLGAFALGAQKLLPAMQQVYSGLTYLKGSSSAILSVVSIAEKDLSHSLSSIRSIGEINSIVLSNVSYRYPNTAKAALKNITINIKSGDRIGIVGETGCGKSTLIDILLGLIKPSSGIIEVNGIDINANSNRGYLDAWYKSISHVPQSIFLFDGSIMENIAFGIHSGSIDNERVKFSASMAKISDYIESLPNSYNTLVGERGISLSGGQLQRIGIARAFYNESRVVILDEATSALDHLTEIEVIKSIDNSIHASITIMIAHRLSTLAGCDYIIRMEDGCISSIETDPSSFK